MYLSNILLIFSFISLCMLVWYFFRYQKAKSTKKWEKSKGQITAAYLEVSSSGSEWGTVYTYTPNIHYKFTVDNRNYTSTNISYSDESVVNENRANRFINKYSPGKKPYVYYNPNDPNESVLLTGARAYNYLNIFGWLSLTVILFAASFSEGAKGKLIDRNSFLSKNLYDTNYKSNNT